MTAYTGRKRKMKEKGTKTLRNPQSEKNDGVKGDEKGEVGQSGGKT